MNNRGFTIIESLLVIFIISIMSIGIIHYTGSTLSIDKNVGYKLLLDNVEKVSYDYIFECNNHVMECNYTWIDNKVNFYAVALINAGYFNDLKSPLDGRDLSYCLRINAIREEANITVNVVDECN